MKELFAISAPTIDAEDAIRVLPQDATTDAGMRLFTDIVARGDAAEHIEEWFRSLGMPCHPNRIFKKITSSSSKMPGHADKRSRAHYTARYEFVQPVLHCCELFLVLLHKISW